MYFRLFCLTALLVNVKNIDNANAMLPSTSNQFEDVLKTWYPDDAEFNESCVSEDCPALNNFSLCHKEINITVLHNVFKTAFGCMRKPICGILIDMRPIPRMTFTTDEWLPEMEIDGIATASHGAGYLSNVSTIELELTSDHKHTHQLPLQITIFTSYMRLLGNFNLNLILRTMLPPILGQPLSVSIPHVKYDIEVDYISTMFINHSLTSCNYEIKVINPIIRMYPVFCGLYVPDGFPSIQTLITTMAKVLAEKSSWAVRKTAFMEKYFQSAICIASDEC